MERKTKNLNEQRQQPKDRVSLTRKYFSAHRYSEQRLQVRQAEAPSFPRPAISPRSQHLSEAPRPLLVPSMTTLPPFATCSSSSSGRGFLMRHVLILNVTASPMVSQDQLFWAHSFHHHQSRLVMILRIYSSDPGTTLKSLLWPSSTCLGRNISTLPFSNIKLLFQRCSRVHLWSYHHITRSTGVFMPRYLSFPFQTGDNLLLLPCVSRTYLLLSISIPPSQLILYRLSFS